MRRLLTALALTTVAAVAAAESAHACSCAPIDAREALRKSDGAFVGRLLSVKRDDGGGQTGYADPARYVYRVGGVYNGGPGLRRGRRVAVWAPYSDATCGLPHGAGRLYGLFLERDDGRWKSDLCSTTSPRRMRRAAGADPAAARSGESPSACASS